MKIYVSCFIVVIIFSALIVSGQDLVFQADDKTKTIKANTYIKITMTPVGENPCGKCEVNSVIGKLLSSQNDSIQIKVRSSEMTINEDNRPVLLYRRYQSKDAPVISIPKNNVLAVKQQGIHHYKEHTGGETLGQLLALSGGSYMIGSTGVEDDHNSNKMLAVGITTLILGITTAAIAERNLIVTSEFCPNIKEGKRIWSIE